MPHRLKRFLSRSVGAGPAAALILLSPGPLASQVLGQTIAGNAAGRVTPLGGLMGAPAFSVGLNALSTPIGARLGSSLPGIAPAAVVPGAQDVVALPSLHAVPSAVPSAAPVAQALALGAGSRASLALPE